jgi:integrase/recombinase XerD
MTQRNVSQNTIASYRDTFRLLLQFAHKRLGRSPSKLKVQDLDASLVGAFLDDVEHKRASSVRTRNLRLTAIRSFFRFAALEVPEHSGLIQRVLSIPQKRHCRKVVGFLTRDEIEAILAAVDRSTWIGRRDYALLLMMMQTGLRLAEITGLRDQDLTLGVGAHVRCEGKGRKERCTPLTRSTAAVVRAWIAQRGMDTPQLFPNSRGGRLSHDAVQDLVTKYSAAAQKECPSLLNRQITPHMLRHYLPFRTMSGIGTPAQYFRQMREVAHDIVLTPSINPMQGKGVHREVYHRLPSSSFASAGRPARVTYRAVCEVTE